jgi:hypothetical protein
MVPRDYLVLQAALQCYTAGGQPEMLSFVAVACGLRTIFKTIRHL